MIGAIFEYPSVSLFFSLPFQFLMGKRETTADDRGNKTLKHRTTKDETPLQHEYCLPAPPSLLSFSFLSLRDRDSWRDHMQQKKVE